MRSLKRWWIGLSLLALAALTAVAVLFYARPGTLWMPGSPDRDTRAPDALPQTGPTGAPVESPRPPQERPMFKAVRDGAQITLSGLVSRQEARNALIEEAKQAVANATVTEEIKASDAIPSRFDEAAAFALRQLIRLPSGTAILGEEAISIAGQAPDFETYNTIAAAQAPADFRLDLAGLIPPLARPYTWSATSNESGIALAGHVPSAAARQVLGAAAREAFPDKLMIERLQPASGLPSTIDFAAATRFALAQLARLRTGTAELADGKLNLRGDVTDRETLAAVRSAVQVGLPPGLQAGSVAITLSKPSPYAFQARRKDGTLTLTGYYPDAETRTAIHQLVRERFFTEQVVDKLRAADGAPRNYLAGVSFGLEHLSRLASGEAVVSDTFLQVNGEALYPQTAEQTMRTISALPLRGWTGKAEVRLRPPEEADAAQLQSSPP